MKHTFRAICLLICFVLALSTSKTIGYDVENESDEKESKKVDEAGSCGFGWLDSPYGLGILFSQ